MKPNRKLAGLTQVLATVALAGLAGLLVYALAIHPWQMRWGATDSEVTGAFPGDELVAQPQSQSTRAITIDAPAAAIWPWLVQMGQGRGGLYSYEMLENLIGCDMHNADRIVPDWQNTGVGDRVRMYPEGSGPPPYTVAALLPGQALILGHSTEPGGVPSQVTPQTAWGDTWAFILQPVNEQQTRLIIRSRATYADPTMRTIMTIVGPGYFIMERGMLVGIKERVERAAGIAATYTAADGWSVAFLLLALAGLVAATFRGRWPHKLILVPLGTALWVATLFVGFPSFPIAAGVALLIIGALVWDYFPVHTRRPAVMQPSA